MKKLNFLWILTALIFAINVFVYLVKPGGDNVLRNISNALPVFCSLMAVYYIACAVGSFKVFDYTKLAWLLILIGLILYCIAETTYGILDIYFFEISENYPGVPDYIWALGYIPFFIGLAMMFVGYKKSGMPMGKPVLYIAISSLILIVSILIIYFLMIPIINDESTTGIAKAFYLFYPIADILIAIPVCILVYITSLFGSATITKPWKLLALGFILFTIADILYAILDWRGLYGDGNLIDLGWNIGYPLIAISGLHQHLLVKSLK